MTNDHGLGQGHPAHDRGRFVFNINNEVNCNNVGTITFAKHENELWQSQ